jgi:integrase
MPIQSIDDHNEEPEQKAKRKQQRIYESVPEAEFIKLIECTKSLKHQLAFILAYGSGLRISEVTKLTPDNVDLKTNRIFIREGKGMKDRVVNTPKWLKEKHVKMLPLKISERAIQAGFRRSSNRAGINSIIGSYDLMGKNIPIQKYHFHSLRHCVSEDTKILTVDGWKKHTDIKQGEDIYSYNIKEDKIEKDKVQNINVFPFHGEAFHFKTGHMDMLCTPEHNSVFKIAHYKQITPGIKNKNKTVWEEFKLNTVDKILKEKSLRLLKHKTSSNYDGEESIGVDKAALLGWILTDGSINKDRGEIIISQSLSANQHKCEMIEKHLINAQIIYSKKISKFKCGGYSKGIPSQMITFRILKNTSKGNRGRYTPDHEWIYKYLTKEKMPKYNLLNLKQEELLSLYTAIMLGDGVHTGGELCIQNEYQLEFFRTLCSFIGKTAITNLGQHNMKSKGEMKFRTFITNKTDTNILLNKNFNKEQYNGKMWCPTTNNHTWIAQRNGRVFITGNSYATRCIEAGVPLNQLQILLGHESLTTTNRYTKANPKDAIQSVLDKGI